MQMQFDMVIHGDYGGFSLTDEIVGLLRQRGCPWVEQAQRGVGREANWYPMTDDDSIRKDPMFVDIVRELTERVDREVGKEHSKERDALKRRLLHGLQVVTVTIEIEIEDHDGLESVRVFGGNW
jgi:hypothetical protein